MSRVGFETQSSETETRLRKTCLEIPTSLKLHNDIFHLPPDNYKYLQTLKIVKESEPEKSENRRGFRLIASTS